MVRFHLMLALLGATLLAGCQAGPPRSVWAQPQDDLRVDPQSDRPMSLVFTASENGSPMEADSDTREGMLPWYADRRDRRPTVFAGVVTPVWQQSVTYQIDRQTESGGDVRYYSSQTTYRLRVRGQSGP